MALPDVIAKLLTARSVTFNPEAEHADYKANLLRWRSYLDLFELDGGKLAGMIDEHDGEDAEKLKLRKQLAAVFNYVPTIIRMLVNYIYSEQPVISVEDAALATFLTNCDGADTSISDYTRQTVLPLALIFGFLDVLIQNPATEDGLFLTKEDEVAAELTPRMFAITPLQRINWSARANHEYNWIRFRDRDDDFADPFIADSRAGTSYVTISRAIDGISEGGNTDVGFWMRSWYGKAAVAGVTTPEADDNTQLVDQTTPAGGATGGAPAAATAGGVGWRHDGGWTRMRRVPIETIYYSRSNDPDKRHDGLSKIAMIAVLTRKIIQLLSWTDEDVLANLAIFVFPGPQPVDPETHLPIQVKLTAFKIIWLGKDAKIPPEQLQGSTDTIDIKLKIIDIYIREILRLSYLIGASAQAEQITSGVQGVVARNELFQELADLAGSLDRFVVGALWHAHAWSTGEDITREEFIKKVKPTVNFFKGPYAAEPLADAIKNAQALIETFRDISPTMVEQVLRSLVTSFLYNEDEARKTAFDEISGNAEAVVQQRAAAAAALTAGLNQAGGGDTIVPESGGDGVPLPPAAQ